MADANSWHEAAARASFAPFEAIGPATTMRRAGGWGVEPGVTTSLHVISLIGGMDGIEVDVQTGVPHPRQTIGDRLRLVVHDVVSRFTIELTYLDLPLALTIVADDRQLAVESTSVTFHGVRLDGASRWMGVADVDGVRVVVDVAAETDFTIRRCVDAADLPVLPFDAADPAI